MLERRQHPRDRVYYGGVIAFNARNSTLDCVVRNFSPYGAKIEFENAAMLPDNVELEVVRKGLFLPGALRLARSERCGLDVFAKSAITAPW